MDIFVELGERIAERWERYNLDNEIFGEIAAEALQGSDVFERVTLADLSRWFLTSRTLPPQAQRRFGQPPVNLYSGRGFSIELRFWVDAPITIHQHAFSGAFAMLHGSSFHTQYDFKRSDTINLHMQIGDLSFRRAETLRLGEVREILVRDQFIHSLVHLEQPSITLVVWTGFMGAYSPQFRYYRPGLAIDPFHDPEPLSTQLKLLDTLQRTQPELFVEIAESLLRRCDLWLAYKILELTALHDIYSALFGQFAQIVRSRHSRIADVMVAGLRENLRQRMVKGEMDRISNEDERYLLAMILNAPGRTVIDRLLQERFPRCDPNEKLVELVSALSQRGQSGLRFNGKELEMLPYALRGIPFGETLQAAFPGTANRDVLKRDWYALHSAPFLRPLLAESAAAARAPAAV